jgi:hypothetical protein
MSVTTPVPAGTAPTSPDDVWAPASMFTANWGERVITRSGFETQIDHAESASEQRFGFLGKPFRSVAATLQAFSAEQSRDLMTVMMRGSVCGSIVPLWSDKTQLTAAAAATDTVISCDTTYRRIFATYRVAIIARNKQPQAATFEIATVASVTSTTISLADPLTNSYPLGAIVVPLIEARIVLENKGSVKTDKTMSVPLQAIEVAGDTQLPLINAIGSTPSGMSTYLSYPVFVADTNYDGSVDVGVRRYGSLNPSGITALPTVQGDRASWTFGIPLLCLDRASAWKVISLFESRAGRLHPFWLPSPVTEYTVISIAGTAVQVTATGSVYDWTFRPYFFVLYSDGTFQCRAVSSVSRSSGVDTLTLDGTLTIPTGKSVVRATQLVLVRSDSDELEESWNTNRCMACNLDLVEVLKEKSVTIANLDVLTSSDLAQAFELGACASDPFFRPDGLISYDFNVYLGPTLPWGGFAGPCSPDYGGELWPCAADAIAPDQQSPPDFTTYIGLQGTVELILSLSNHADPMTNTGHVMSARVARNVTSGLTVSIKLYQGHTEIADMGTITPTVDFTNYTYTLSAGEADSITNYSDLRVRFFSTGEGSMTGIVLINQFFLQTPNPP